MTRSRVKNDFSVGINDGADANAIAIDNSNNVGIGIATPSDKLHVYGGSSGGTAAHSYTQLHVEHSTHAAIQLSTPNNAESTIFFGDPQDNDIGAVGYYHAQDFLYLRSYGAIRLRVDADGIKFGSDSAAANALDDYEEGTWTPTASSNVSSISSANGHYTKVGNLVTVSFFATITPSSTSTQIRIGGLPYAVADKITGTNFEGTSVCFEDQALYFFAAFGNTSDLWIEFDRPIQGSSDTQNRSYRGSVTYYAA
jgi:hypothetical protein